MIEKLISLRGGTAKGYEVTLPQDARLVLAVAEKGFVMCGFLNTEAAEKFQQAAAVVTGVKTVEDLLSKPVTGVTAKAQALGATPGQTGKDALENFL